MTKENFFARLFSFFKKKPQDGEKSISQTPIVDNDKLQKKITHLESEIANYKKEITSLEQQLAERQKVQFSGSEIGEKYLALKADFDTKEKELKKLKRDVDDLKEEVEDLEDDKKEQKKKYEREIEQKIEEFHKVLIQLTEEKESLVVKIKDLETDKRLKSDSISFVNNILNARDADSKDYKYIFNKTTEICNYIQNEVADIFKNILNRPIPDIQVNLYKWRNTELKTWLKDKKVIAIVGEFSSGKTSLVNKILNPNNDPKIIELPTSSKETTAIPTYIEYANDFYSHFVAPNGELKRIDTATFQMTKKEILDQVNVLSLIDTFVLGYKNPYIQNISILDTPGFGSNNKKLIEKTVASIKEASAVFWLIDANTGEMNQSSINTIKEHLKGTELYIILNKCDTKSERDLAALEAKVRSTVQQQGITVKQFLRFSTKNDMYRVQLMNVINALNVQTNSNYIAAIKSLLDSSLKRKEEEYKGIQQQISNLIYNKDRKQNEIRNNTKSAVDACRNLGVTFNEHQNSLLGFEYGDKYYKMKYEDKERYDRNVARITEIVNRFSSQNNELLNIENQITTLGKQTEELKIDKKRIEQVTANLSRLITEYSNKR
ncbi:dynamin family protein [Capnocytophaga granulosa]